MQNFKDFIKSYKVIWTYAGIWTLMVGILDGQVLGAIGFGIFKFTGGFPGMFFGIITGIFVGIFTGAILGIILVTVNKLTNYKIIGIIVGLFSGIALAIFEFIIFAGFDITNASTIINEVGSGYIYYGGIGVIISLVSFENIKEQVGKESNFNGFNKFIELISLSMFFWAIILFLSGYYSLSDFDLTVKIIWNIVLFALIIGFLTALVYKVLEEEIAVKWKNTFLKFIVITIFWAVILLILIYFKSISDSTIGFSYMIALAVAFGSLSAIVYIKYRQFINQILPGVLVILFVILILHLGRLSYQNPVKLDENDNGHLINIQNYRVLDVTAGYALTEGSQMLVINLKANPAVGYWEVTELDRSILQPGRTSFEYESYVPDAKSMQTLRFWLIKPGTTPLKLVYHRLQDTEPLKTFSINVIVY